MTLLVKLGGTLLDAADTRDRLTAQIAAARASGAEIVVVHGGGRQMTRHLTERGIESRFVNGLRVTTPETLDAVLQVFAGSVNHQLVASLNRAGALAVGRILRGLLFEVTPADPLTVASVAVVLLGVAAVACYIPAFRVTRADPLAALRYE